MSPSELNSIPNYGVDPRLADYVEPDRYQAKLSVTDDQWGMLVRLVEKERRRVEIEFSKPQTEKKHRALRNALHDWKEIETTMADNAW